MMLSKITANLLRLVLYDNKAHCLEIDEYRFFPGSRQSVLVENKDKGTRHRITTNDGKPLKCLSDYLIPSNAPSLAYRQSAYKTLSDYLIKYYLHLVCLEAL